MHFCGRADILIMLETEELLKNAVILEFKQTIDKSLIITRQ